MSIRIRRISSGQLVALCAAETIAQTNDIYLDDEVHHALYRKFTADRDREDDNDPPSQQIDRLAKFIMAEVPGEPSRSEGAVDTAIRLLTEKVRAVDPDRAHAANLGEIATAARGEGTFHD